MKLPGSQKYELVFVSRTHISNMGEGGSVSELKLINVILGLSVLCCVLCNVSARGFGFVFGAPEPDLISSKLA